MVWIVLFTNCRRRRISPCRSSGSLQGGVISRLIANSYLVTAAFDIRSGCCSEFLASVPSSVLPEFQEPHPTETEHQARHQTKAEQSPLVEPKIDAETTSKTQNGEQERTKKQTEVEQEATKRGCAVCKAKLVAVWAAVELLMSG